MVNGADDVYVERKGRIERVQGGRFEGEEVVLHVQSIRPSEIEQTFGWELYGGLGEEERRLFWVRIRPVDEPPLEQWG